LFPAIAVAGRLNCVRRVQLFFLNRLPLVDAVQRAEAGMCLALEQERGIDGAQPINQGVTADRRVTDRRGIRVREITFCDPRDGEVYVCLTNEMTLEPGLLALLCVAIVHNLLLLLQDGHRQQGVESTAEIQRRQKRLDQQKGDLAKTGQTLPLIYTRLQRFTQATFKLIRWLRVHGHQPTSLPQALLQLRSLYARL
jgi:hypothetical protein